jgi:DNA repair protein RecN (Recombination protein N)
MLTRLKVSNFVLIENEELTFHNGFSVITGETGSGKSILLGALKLILGERADYAVIRDSSKKTIVEGTFVVEETRFPGFFKQHDLDFSEETIIRREIDAKGKSRAFINDTPVQLAVLNSFTEKLIHIHSQHNTIQLKNKAFQLNILDAFADTSKDKEKLETTFCKYKLKDKELEERKNAIAELTKEYDFLLFQLNELEALALDKVDYFALEKKLKAIEQSEEISQSFAAISHVIDEKEDSVESQLKTLLRTITADFPDLVALKERLESALIELNDISAEAQIAGSNLSFPDEDINELTTKLDVFNHALRKHQVSSQTELMKLCNNIRGQVDTFSNADEDIKVLEEARDNLYTAAMHLAERITEARKAGAVRFEQAIKTVLDSLKLTDAYLQFAFEKRELGINGMDEVSIQFSPNKGMAASAVEKAASGGELSRLMLAIHYLLSQKRNLPTVIFDEIDTGVSGEVASKIGQHLKKMGEHMQLMAITHLPQVAAAGKHHYVVEKHDNDDKTFTRINELNEVQRVEEVARLMSGEQINEAARTNAMNLLND